MGEYSTYGGSIIENAVGNCPEVKMGGVDVGCLIDTGAEVLLKVSTKSSWLKVERLLM